MATYQFKQFKAFHLQLVLAHWNEPWVSQADLATRFGITQAWASQILTSPESREIIEQLKNRSLDTIMDVQAQLQAIAPVALQERIKIAMDAGTPIAIRDRSLQSILEMAGHSPVKRVQLQRGDPVAERIAAMSDAEIQDDLLKVVGANTGPDGRLIN